jgi:hypothetical protein
MLNLVKKTRTLALLCLSATALFSVSVHAEDTKPADSNPPAKPAFCEPKDPSYDEAKCKLCDPDKAKNPNYDASKCPSPAKDGNPPAKPAFCEPKDPSYDEAKCKLCDPDKAKNPNYDASKCLAAAA